MSSSYGLTVLLNTTNLREGEKTDGPRHGYIVKMGKRQSAALEGEFLVRESFKWMFDLFCLKFERSNEGDFAKEYAAGQGEGGFPLSGFKFANVVALNFVEPGGLGEKCGWCCTLLL